MSNNNIGLDKVVPFIRWVGGKSWLFTNYPELFPKDYNRYIEPFLGGGAIFFSLKPKKAILSDLNDDLIDVYRVIKNEANKLEKLLFHHHKNHCKDYYYVMRKKILRAHATKAARFIYLNRTCWNGLYRVNLNGDFNVPVGTKTKVILPTDNFQGVSKLLKKVDLRNHDFEKIVSMAKKNDFVFIDPPYTVKHNNNNFRKYNEKIFSWNDQVRLNDAVRKAIKRGAKVMVCNANNIAIRDLYKSLGKITSVYRNSVLAADPKNRHIVSEIVIRSKNFK